MTPGAGLFPVCGKGPRLLHLEGFSPRPLTETWGTACSASPERPYSEDRVICRPQVPGSRPASRPAHSTVCDASRSRRLTSPGAKGFPYIRLGCDTLPHREVDFSSRLTPSYLCLLRPCYRGARASGGPSGNSHAAVREGGSKGTPFTCL